MKTMIKISKNQTLYLDTGFGYTGVCTVYKSYTKRKTVNRH